MPRGRKARSKTKAGYMISAVAEMYNIHPQTLRLYEREGLLLPSRSEGNTRLYTEEDLERLEVILSLTRDLGVNLAGIEIILNMRARMKEMESEVQALVEFTRRAVYNAPHRPSSQPETGLVRVGRRHIIRTRSAQAG
ncbi:MAG TPA: helix-turn-helix transcriptional regulator [Terriglobia bacterium]|nr:helix-turn-helix transcriptional regulator [Terriglobia bacterium]